jgi:hypothetical protein
MAYAERQAVHLVARHLRLHFSGIFLARIALMERASRTGNGRHTVRQTPSAGGSQRKVVRTGTAFRLRNPNLPDEKRQAESLRKSGNPAVRLFYGGKLHRSANARGRWSRHIKSDLQARRQAAE